ncbi:helix-turn-helix domain-containing protein [Streptomyces niveus]|uniref:helix-turn-helix domain-containing protein n=1 Tax=Streptomyces niveus TaxID=193462 RepID=UPI0036C09693
MTGQAGRAQRRVRNLHDEAVPIAQRLVLGTHLRARRKELKIPMKQAGRHIGVSEPTMSRTETGQLGFKLRDVERLLDLYDVLGESRLAYLDLLDHANRTPWWQDWKDVAGKHLQAFVSFEEMAQRLRAYDPSYITGLLQTEEYAHAVIEQGLPDATTREVERLTELRVVRHQRFDAAKVKQLICVVDELTLVRPYGSTAVMRRQLDHLIALMDDPRYTLRIAELTKPNIPTNVGMTVIFDFEEQVLPAIVYAEHFDGAFILQDEEQVDGRIKAFDRLQAASLSHSRAAQRLRDLRKKL